MAAGTVVTLLSLPIYAGLYHAYGGIGLAFASDIGIAMQTLAIAGLLHQRHMVSLASLDYGEMGRCIGASIASGAVTWVVFSWLAGLVADSVHLPTHSRWYQLTMLAMGSLVWAGISFGVLRWTGSALPRVLMKRMRLA
jgi:putative peptidoglycan lipid II flippase